jgi:hypothetical protein
LPVDLAVARHLLRRQISGGGPFDPATGLPATGEQAASLDVSWYEHARAFTEAKWPHLAPTSRRSADDALTAITVALVSSRRGAPDPAVLRRALFAWAFNHAAPGARS